MSFRKVMVVVVALVAASVGVGAAPAASAAPPKPPKWVEHVQRYPGGISNGVRSAVDEGNQSAQQGQHGAGEFHGGLNNVRKNDDPTPDKPQNETQVVISLRNPMVAVAASNDYFSGGIWIGRTTDGGRTDRKSTRL